MKVLLYLLTCQCFTSLFAQCPSQPKWHAKFSPKAEAAHDDGEAFFEMPINISEAVSQGWVAAEISDHEAVLCLGGDPRVGIIFGKDGWVVGVDIAVPVADWTSPYMVKDNPEFFNVTRLGQRVIVSRMYFVNPDVLRKGGRRHLDCSVLSELFLKKGKDLVNIPTNETLVEKTTLYTREGCIPAMGRHYYYNMSVELSCLNFKPWFLLFDVTTRELIGIGFQMFGNPSYQNRKWFEDTYSPAIKATIPNAPDCLTEWAETYNAIPLHLYFGSMPWAISCNSSA